MNTKSRSLKAFCRRTGWPIEEFADMPFLDAVFILGIHGLEVSTTGLAGPPLNWTRTLYPEGF